MTDRRKTPIRGFSDGTSALRARFDGTPSNRTLARIDEFFASARSTQSPLARGKKVISKPAYAGKMDFFNRLSLRKGVCDVIRQVIIVHCTHYTGGLLQKQAERSMSRLSPEDYSAFLRSLQTINSMRLSLLIEGVTPAEFSLLYCAAESAQPVSVAQAAKQLGVSMPAVSRALKTLEGAQLIGRRTDEADRRSVLIELTDEGRELVKRNLSRITSAADRIIGRFSDEELSTMVRLQEKLAQGVSEIMAELSQERPRTQKGEN